MMQLEKSSCGQEHCRNTSKSIYQEKIHISFFEACFLILYFHVYVCIYVTYMNKLVFKPKVYIIPQIT